MKTLVIRLSSLGDVVLSTSGLQKLETSQSVDWLVSEEFSGLLVGHPKIGRLWTFSRRSKGLLDWIRLAFELRRERYGQVIDLHRNLRTLILRLILMDVRWTSISKRRWRRWGLFVFKSHWPRIWRPRIWTQEFSRVLSGSDAGRPSFTHLLAANGEMEFLSPPTSNSNLGPKTFWYAVMPDSAWEGKCWPSQRYADLIESLREGYPIILGSRKDLRSHELIEELRARDLPFEVALELPWSDLARVLGRCTFLVGNDTGLAHLAESLGVPTVVIFGPTSPEMGFRPSLDGSRVVESPIACRPCSSDGRRCYWSGDARYQCLKNVSVSQVRGACIEVARRARKGQSS